MDRRQEAAPCRAWTWAAAPRGGSHPRWGACCRPSCGMGYSSCSIFGVIGCAIYQLYLAYVPPLAVAHWPAHVARRTAPAPGIGPSQHGVGLPPKTLVGEPAVSAAAGPNLSPVADVHRVWERGRGATG